jgi:NADPH-dependent glutamate synthase beta subunit-like oxidoreductase
VGSGPAGLSCAYFLAEQGFEVTVYEQLSEVGGMLRAGIPDFRLPRDILDKNLARLRDLGVEFRTGVAIGEDPGFEELRREHDALFLATGFSDPRPIGIPGQEHKEVLHGLHLLRDINFGEPPALGKRMLVVGGGNTALDVARSVKRLGCEPTIVYRRALDDMPAIEEEVQAIRAEGVPVVPYAVPVKIEKEGGCLRVTLVKMQPGPFDESGRRRPVPVTGSEYVEEYEQVATAVGETAGLSNLPPEIEHDQRLVTTDFGNATNVEGIFAGGDLSTGFGTVAHAIRSGRKGADAIAAYLAGK